MEKILFVTRNLTEKEISGGLSVSRRNYNLLQNIYGTEDIDLFIIEKPSFFLRLKNLVLRQGYGQTHKNFSDFKKKMEEKYRFVFYNSSVYGTFIRYGAKKNIKQIVFYHNIEYKYYLEKFYASKKITDYIYARFIKRNELLASKYSDYRFTFNRRDSNEMMRTYNVSATLELPITFPMTGKEKIDLYLTHEEKPYFLFVGSDFFANSDGLSWFVENVMPHIHIDFYIIGSVCNSLKKYKSLPNIHLLGYVDNLEKYYANASFIVSPIFTGSGMKTKTVEALSYGKTIFGTEEAFVGIEGDYNKIGALCMTSQSFISAISKYDMSKTYNEYAYDLFREKYSDEAIISKIHSFLIQHKFL